MKVITTRKVWESQMGPCNPTSNHGKVFFREERNRGVCIWGGVWFEPFFTISPGSFSWIRITVLTFPPSLPHLLPQFSFRNDFWFWKIPPNMVQVLPLWVKFHLGSWISQGPGGNTCGSSLLLKPGSNTGTSEMAAEQQVTWWALWTFFVSAPFSAPCQESCRQD